MHRFWYKLLNNYRELNWLGKCLFWICAFLGAAAAIALMISMISTIIFLAITIITFTTPVFLSPIISISFCVGFNTLALLIFPVAILESKPPFLKATQQKQTTQDKIKKENIELKLQQHPKIAKIDNPGGQQKSTFGYKTPIKWDDVSSSGLTNIQRNFLGLEIKARRLML